MSEMVVGAVTWRVVRPDGSVVYAYTDAIPGLADLFPWHVTPQGALFIAHYLPTIEPPWIAQRYDRPNWVVVATSEQEQEQAGAGP